MKTLKKIVVISILSLTVFTSLTAATQKETDALVTFYKSTNGDNWTDNDNWKTGDPCRDVWIGVDCSDDNNSIIGLDLNTNQLIGSIPPEIEDLINLEIFDLYANELTGSIPLEIGSLTNLTVLDLGDNQLTGSIPSEIGRLTNLTELYLDENQLTGSIPTEIGSMESLTELYLDENQLTGSIPVEIVDLGNLTDLFLSFNCNLYSDDTSVQNFIDDVEEGDTYQDILDTNTHDCDKSNPVLAPVIMYLLN